MALRATQRLGGLIESRGLAKTAWFVATRLVRWQDELLFAADPASQGARFADQELRLLELDAATVDHVLPAEVHHRLFAGEGCAYREGIRKGDLGFVLLGRDSSLLHHSFVQFAVRTKTLLGESRQVPLIAHCMTVAQARGRRLYPRVLRHVMQALAAAGHRRVAINCDSDNVASIRGIEHAGFTRIARLRSLIVVNRLCVQLRSPGGLRVCRL